MALVILATVTQLADLITASPLTEVHPIGVMLVGTAYALPAKLSLLAYIMAVAAISTRQPRIKAFVLIACSLGGGIGAISNVIA